MAKNIQKIVLLADNKNKKLSDLVLKHIDNHKTFEVINCKVSNNFINSIIENYKNLVAKKAHTRMIIIDDYGILPFMVASKIPNSIVAQLEDEHSARMTMEHNNSNVIILGSKILGEELLLSIIDAYLFAKYEGGRHKVRLDMLTKLLESERF